MSYTNITLLEPKTRAAKRLVGDEKSCGGDEDCGINEVCCWHGVCMLIICEWTPVE